MEVLQKQAAEENKKLEKRKGEIDIELSEVEPLVREAKQAVGSIKSETLGEIRALRAPPDVIRDILEAVLRLMGILDTSWVSMKRSVCLTLSLKFGKQRSLRLPSMLDVCCCRVTHETISVFVCSFLAKRGVKEEIQNFDARKISPDIRKNVEGFLKKNGASFEPKVFLRLSFALQFVQVDSLFLSLLKSCSFVSPKCFSICAIVTEKTI